MIGGYVLGALEPTEMDAVRRHLAGCPECAAEHARLDELPDLLDFAGAFETSAEHPPAQLEDAVLDRFAREHPSPQPPRRRRRVRELLTPFRRPLPAALAGALAAAAVAVAIAIPGGGGGESAWNGAPGDVYNAELTGSPAVPNARGDARLVTASAGTRVWLHVNGLKGQPDNLYELWCVRDDGSKISAGTFRVDSQGRADVNLTTAAVIGDYHRLSIERRLQPPAASSGQRVMAGEIRYGTS